MFIMQTCLHSNTDKHTLKKKNNKKKKKNSFLNFQFLATAQGQCFLFMSLLLPSATEKSEQP